MRLQSASGRIAFEAAARDEAYLTQVLHQQDAQSVIAFGRAYAPAAEQIDGERERIAARDVVDGDDGDLREAPLTQRGADGVDMRHGGRRQDTVGIGDIAPPVHTLNIGNLVRAVGSRKGGQRTGEQQAKDRNVSHAAKIKKMKN